jgi:secreted PhoX family phosphatase
VRKPVRLTGYGRFHHEAAAIDPRTSICYLTEDRHDGCLYRFVPHDAARPFEGRLQALRIAGSPRTSTQSWTTGDAARIDWVDLDDTDPTADTLRAEAHDKGAATIRRGEGLWAHADEIWFTATEGGPAGTGQIFRLRRSGGGQRIEVVIHSEDTAALDFPDNITFSPAGQLFVCEDGRDGNTLRALTQDHMLVPFARNALSGSEFSGVCFSPDGRVMFVNLQHDGLTLAITGPFATAR